MYTYPSTQGRPISCCSSPFHSRKAGKNINLTVIGEETELDRNVVEQIVDPLMHMVRNSVDHGIEAKEERIGAADAFIALTRDDEHNILASAQAKSVGVKTAIAVVQRTVYMHLLPTVGIDRAFSPRVVAVAEIRKTLDHGPVRLLASLSQGTADVYEITPTRRATAVGKELRNLELPANCMNAPLEASTWSSCSPFGNTVISSIYAPFHAARFIFT